MHVMGLSNGTVRTKVTRDADDHLLELGGSYTPTGTWVWTSAVATWPTFNQDTTGLTNANVPNPSAIAGSGAQTANKRSYVICTSSATITLPAPVAGNQIIVRLLRG